MTDGQTPVSLEKRLVIFVAIVLQLLLISHLCISLIPIPSASMLTFQAPPSFLSLPVRKSVRVRVREKIPGSPRLVSFLT